MNKKLFPIIIFPLILSISACGGSEKDNPKIEPTPTPEPTPIPTPGGDIDNQEEVDNLKSLLAKQDLSPFNEKSFYANYQQNFTVYTNSLDDEGKYVDFFNYRGSGNFGYYYDVDEEEYEKIIEDEDSNIFDIMRQGFGYYLLVQYATIQSFLNFNDEVDEKEEYERFTYIQQLEALLDEENFQIDNTFIFSDFYDDENFDYRTFKGKISKDNLFSSYTTKTINDIFSRVNIYDGPGNCEAIDSFYYQLCLSLLESSDKEISEFIINNNIEYIESNKYSELSFEIKEEKYLEQLGDNDVIPGIIKGTLYLNKETKELEEYEYRIIHLEQESDLDRNYIHAVSMEFIAEGYSRHGKPEEDPYVSEEAVIYDDSNLFVQDVMEEVIPPIAK